jgi:hypothetical protein
MAFSHTKPPIIKCDALSRQFTMPMTLLQSRPVKIAIISRFNFQSIGYLSGTLKMFTKKILEFFNHFIKLLVPQFIAHGDHTEGVKSFELLEIIYSHDLY